jgi:hypothetical protein
MLSLEKRESVKVCQALQPDLWLAVQARLGYSAAIGVRYVSLSKALRKNSHLGLSAECG